MANKKKKPVNLAAAWMSVIDVRAAIARSRDTHAKLTKRLAHLNGEVERTVAQSEPNLVEFSPKERETILRRMVGSKRAELRRNTADERQRLLRDIASINDQLASAKTHFKSPVQMLMRHSLGTERRSRLIEQLASSGPSELGSLAALAASTKDYELAAALCSRVSELPRGQRPFSAHDLADALMGDDFREVNKSILEADRLTLEALSEDGTFETGRASNRGVKLALMKREEEAFDAIEDDPEDDSQDADDETTKPEIED
jgi:hypothetical protein